jgi:hypothetical protein
VSLGLSKNISTESRELREEWRRLGQEAAHRNLIFRCLVGLPEIRWHRSDVTEPSVEMAGNLGTYLADTGRFDEALAYADKCVAARGEGGRVIRSSWTGP